MKKFEHIPEVEKTIYGKIFPIWLSVQTDMHRSKRWGIHHLHPVAKNMRRQSSLQHSKSFNNFCDVCILLLQPHIKNIVGRKLDESLLMRGINIHDDPEGFAGNKNDTSALSKTDEDDLNEYLLFKEKYSVFPGHVYKKQEYAYLLQFAIKNPACFPDDAREVMDKIKKHHYWEALTKNALEKAEYFMYPYEMRNNHKYLIVWFIRLRLDEYRHYATELPGFREEIFTHELESWMVRFLEENKDVPNRNDYLVSIGK